MDPEEMYGEGQQEQGDGGGNPAWQGFLDVIPQELHPKVTPVLKDWDTKVNQRFEKVHSDYADFKPFKDNGVTRQQLEQGLNLLNAISVNPHEVYKAMREAYRFEDEVAPVGQGQQEQVDDEPWKKQYEQLQSNYETIARILLSDREAKESAHQDELLNQELTQLRNKYGDYDEEWVLAKLMVNPKTQPEEAVKAYKTWESAQQARFGPKPLFMTGHGGVPSGDINTRKMSEKDVKALIAERLMHAQRQQD